MKTQIILEAVGYLASLLVLISLLMSSVVKLRVINMIGSFIFAIYAVLIHSYPTALMNACLVGINIYYLIRLTKSDRNYTLIDGTAEDAYLQYFLQYYGKDIKTCFPGIALDTNAVNAAYVVCCDATPAGVLLGTTKEDGTLEIMLDYSTPEYRDCSVGAYLYEKLAKKGIRRVLFQGNALHHKAYLKKMGFVPEAGTYVKVLS